MADEDEEDVSPGGGAGTYSRLLFGEDDVVVSLGADSDGCLNFTPPSSSGCYRRNSPGSEVHLPPNKKKRHVKSEGKDSAHQNRGKPINNPPGNSSERMPLALRRSRERGDRSLATELGHCSNSCRPLERFLINLKSGDTVSVLTEANGYIRSLQDQVHVLCSPYLLTPPPSITEEEEEDGGGGGGENRGRGVLRRRGLCLVPIDIALPLVSHYDFTGDGFLSRAAVSGTAAQLD